MKKGFILLGWVSVVILATGFGQKEQQNSMAQSQMLMRKVADGDLAYVTTVQAFSMALQKTNTAGGIVRLSDCQENTVVQKWQPLGATLEDVLDGIAKADPQYRWDIEDGVVNVLPAGDEPALLKTHISTFIVKRPASPDTALYKLLVLPEVKASLHKLGLNEALRAVVIPMPLGPSEVRHTVRCKNVTLREALNAIARTFGNAVWAYKERHCAGKDEFSLDFVVQ